MSEYHVPVLLDETIEALQIRPRGLYVDGTAGGGGHSPAILSKLTGGKLFCIDRDPDAIDQLSRRFSGCENATVIHGRYGDMNSLMSAKDIFEVDGVLLDIGVSSHQLDTPGRGFSYHADAPLDMRMEKTGESAADLVNTLPWQALAEIFTKYGEEKFSPRVAKSICAAREIAPIETTRQLAEIISAAYPAAARRNGHPARKVFQALRIAVNGELDELEQGLDGAFKLLKPGGRLAVITFHSLEDRIVKQTMARWATGCICPPQSPVCTCGRTPEAVVPQRKPVEPSEAELAANPRSRSAKLRVCEKIK